jgi:hypothetical protein
MPYQPTARYQLIESATYSAYSRPRRDHADGSYEIHLVKATDPHYIPGEMEIWPIFHDAINQALEDHPAAAQAAVAACRQVQKEYEGRKNRDL